MEINSLRCNHCSVNLEINRNIKFFTCTNCGCSLTIKSSGNVLYTEVLDENNGNTELLADRNDRLIIEQEIERLDSEWLLEREQFGIKVMDHENNKSDTFSKTTKFIVSIFVKADKKKKRFMEAKKKYLAKRKALLNKLEN